MTWKESRVWQCSNAGAIEEYTDTAWNRLRKCKMKWNCEKMEKEINEFKIISIFKTYLNHSFFPFSKVEMQNSTQAAVALLEAGGNAFAEVKALEPLSEITQLRRRACRACRASEGFLSDPLDALILSSKSSKFNSIISIEFYYVLLFFFKLQESDVRSLTLTGCPLEEQDCVNKMFQPIAGLKFHKVFWQDCEVCQRLP